MSGESVDSVLTSEFTRNARRSLYLDKIPSRAATSFQASEGLDVHAVGGVREADKAWRG